MVANGSFMDCGGRPRARVAVPDRVVVHEPERCEGCGESLAEAELVGVERRQVFEIPSGFPPELCECLARWRRSEGAG